MLHINTYSKTYFTFMSINPNEQFRVRRVCNTIWYPVSSILRQPLFLRKRFQTGRGQGQFHFEARARAAKVIVPDYAYRFVNATVTFHHGGLDVTKVTDFVHGVYVIYDETFLLLKETHFVVCCKFSLVTFSSYSGSSYQDICKQKIYVNSFYQ
jgi:hypothetical protein